MGFKVSVTCWMGGNGVTQCLFQIHITAIQIHGNSWQFNCTHTVIIMLHKQKQDAFSNSTHKTLQITKGKNAGKSQLNNYDTS